MQKINQKVINKGIRYHVEAGILPYTFEDHRQPAYNYYQVVSELGKRLNLKLSTNNNAGVWTISVIN